MATTYSTKIRKVSVAKTLNGLTNVVTRVWFTIISTSDDGYIKHNYKQLDLPSPSSDGFVGIDAIDEATLITWIEAQPDYLTDEEKTVIESRIQFERNFPQYDDYKFPWMPEDDLRYNFSR